MTGVTRQFITKDSGNREQFGSGAVRDTRVGKGRYDLIPAEAIQRMAGVYERGAVKYDDNNWKKGMLFSRTIDSALRHINQWQRGEQDEDHLGHAVFNLFAIMYFEERRPDLNDMEWATKAENGSA